MTPLSGDPARSDMHQGHELRGTGIATGVAVGRVLFLDNELPVPPRHSIPEAEVASELKRFGDALETAEQEFRDQAEAFGAGFDGAEKRIFDTHLHFYRDEVFREAIEKRIREESLNVEAAIHDEVLHLTGVLAGMDSIFRERQADIRDVGMRIRRVLLRRQQEELKGGDQAFVLYARELMPSDTMSIDRSRLLGIVTELGGAASHVAILARAFDIPAVSGIQSLQTLAMPGARLAVDGTAGRVVVDPSPEQLVELDAAAEQHKKARQALASRAVERARFEKASGLSVYLNIENFESLDPGLLESTDGIGLYRTEFLFMGRNTFPSEEEQFEFYRGVLERAGDREVTFRTIDVGGDKPLRYLQIPRELNPALGWRGIRLTSEWPDLLIPQLRALLRASQHGRLSVLLPMVTHVEEFGEARVLFDRLASDLEQEGVEFRSRPPLGAMIEVPSAAYAARQLARAADFLSVGTNDLGQYFFAVDRNNLRVSRFYQPLHPAMLGLLRDVFAAADAEETPVTVCGEMAGLSMSVLALLGLGLRRFSMSPAHVADARPVFETFEAEEAAQMMKPLLERSTEREVVERLQMILDERLGGE